MKKQPTILDQIGKTPLVRLGALSKGVRNPIWVKCEHLNPGGSIKDRIALAIVDDAEARGAISPGDTLIEATAGNTGMGLALVAAARGYHLVCVMPEKMLGGARSAGGEPSPPIKFGGARSAGGEPSPQILSIDKRVALALAGARVVITANAPPSSPENFRQVAARFAAERGWFLTDQFKNPANVRAHFDGTGVEILEQTDGRIGAFVAGAGTGGTLSGVGRRLKDACPEARVVLADPVGSGLADWVETGELHGDGSYAVEGIGGSEVPANLHRAVLDGAERVSDEESFAMALRLAREEGLYVGGSAGTNVVAALRVAARADVHGPVVTVLPDSWDRYFSKPWMVAAGRAALEMTL